MNTIWNKLLLFVFISLLTLPGCQGQKDTGKSQAKCDDGSNVKLNSNNIETIKLSSSMTNYSGIAANNQSKAYKFDGKKGDKISYQTKPNGFCTWLYASDNRIIKETTLPQDGTYILQVAAAENSGTFDLSMSLGNNNSVPSPEASPAPSTAPSGSPSPDPSSTSNIPTKDEVRNIIGQWLDAKKSIFGSSYNKEAGEKLTTGLAYERNIQAKPGDEASSVDDLKKDGNYYTYDRQEIHDILSTRSISSNEALVKAIVTEHRTLHRSNGSTKLYANNRSSVCYLLQKDGDAWKISKDPSLLTSCN
jgi:ribosomal protein S24E